jgi:ribosomal protein L11 methyltransferase
MRWLQIIFQCTRAQSEMLEDSLLELGALSITYQDAADQPVLEPGVGEMPLWPDIKFSALFMAETNTAAVLQQLKESLPFALPEHRVEILERKDWERAWMDHYRAMRFGQRLWICPSWQQPVDVQAVNLMLDPGLAFGTGTHPTTALCLEWLDAADLKGKRVIDFGCGSGVLGIAALLLGAGFVLAVDNDPQALVATQENARRNHCEDYLRAELFHCNLGESWDIVIANILAKPLIELAEPLKAALKTGGSLVLSGLLLEQAETVMQSYRPEVVFCAPVEQEGWIRLEGIRT